MTTSTRLGEFEDFLRYERGSSEHTIRAYVGDVRALISFAGVRKRAIADIDLDSNDLAETDDNSDNGATTHREERP